MLKMALTSIGVRTWDAFLFHAAFESIGSKQLLKQLMVDGTIDLDSLSPRLADVYDQLKRKARGKRGAGGKLANEAANNEESSDESGETSCKKQKIDDDAVIKLN
jgi:hypothetical protein